MITETETAFLAVIRAFLTEEKASPAEIQGLTEKQWNHLFVLAAQHSLLSAVYDVVGKTPEFAELPDELRRQVKTQAMQSVLQQVSRTALFLSDEKELEHLGVQPLVMKGIVCRSLYPKPDLRPSGDEDLLISEKDFSAVDMAGHRIYDACRGSSVSWVCRGSGASIVSSTSCWPLPT